MQQEDLEDLDEFLLLRIASFISEYNDLDSLSLTCRHLYCLVEPTKQKFQEYYIVRIKMMIQQLETLGTQLSTVQHTEDIVRQYNQINQRCIKLQRKQYDDSFLSMFHRSKLQALLTCVDRTENLGKIKGLSFIKLNLIYNESMQVDISHFEQNNNFLFWFLNVDQSLLSFAFDCDLRITENHDMISKFNIPCSSNAYTDCWLWFSKQPMPKENVKITTISRHVKNVQRYYILNQNCYTITKYLMQPVKFVCNEEQWESLNSYEVICKMKPLSQKQIDYIHSQLYIQNLLKS